MIIDPNAKADTVYYMALYATRNVVIPAVPTRSGFESIDGVADSAQGFAENQDINIGRTAVIPTMVDMRKSDHKDYARKLRDEYDAPVYFKSLSAFESAEEQYVSIFRLFSEHRSRIRKSEQNILPKYRTWSRPSVQCSGIRCQRTRGTARNYLQAMTSGAKSRSRLRKPMSLTTRSTRLWG